MNFVTTRIEKDLDKLSCRLTRVVDVFSLPLEIVTPSESSGCGAMESMKTLEPAATSGMLSAVTSSVVGVMHCIMGFDLWWFLASIVNLDTSLLQEAAVLGVVLVEEAEGDMTQGEVCT